MKRLIFIFTIAISFIACGQRQITNNNDNMTDKEQIIKSYKDMCRYMIDKDTVQLAELMSDDYILLHMTGMRQSKDDYLTSIADGTLNYYDAMHDNISVTINGDSATLIGQSKVTAAVFGGGKHTWRLQSKINYIKQDGKWLQISSQASTY